MTALTDKIEALYSVLNRERMMLADVSWYWDEGMPATAHYLESAFEIHYNLPTILRALRERDQAVEALKRIAPGRMAGWKSGEVATEALASIEGTGHE